MELACWLFGVYAIGAALAMVYTLGQSIDWQYM